MRLKIVVDDKIPLVEEFFADNFILVRKPGLEISPADLIDADMLWVRTLTQVNETLLAKSRVRFVGTATAGFDHLDTDWLEKKGIIWANAPGANATAVAEYVLCCLAALQRRDICKFPARAAVIGVGQVGSRVAEYLRRLGCELVLNDPPRQQQNNMGSIDLEDLTDVDLICVHAALTYAGQFPSYHLLNHDFFQRQKPGCVVINAARGPLIDTQILLQQTHLHLCLDVWENEPNIDLQLLRQATIATPHIAAYSLDAKFRASIMLYHQAQIFFGWTARKFIGDNQQNSKLDKFKQWQDLALAIYNPMAHTKQMQQQLLKNPTQVSSGFLQLRSDYQWRKSWASNFFADPP